MRGATLLAPLRKAVAEVQPGAAWSLLWVPLLAPCVASLLPGSCLSFPSHPTGISAGGQEIPVHLIRARGWQMAGEEPGQGTMSWGPPRRPPKLLQLWALLGDSRMG